MRRPLGEAVDVSTPYQEYFQQAYTDMNESGGDEDASTEMLAEEENLRWDLHPLDLFSYDWKAATTDRSEEDDDYSSVSYLGHCMIWISLTDCSHMQREIVLGAICLTTTHGLLHVGHIENIK